MTLDEQKAYVKGRNLTEKEKSFIKKAQELYELGMELGYNDPFHAGTAREAIMALLLKHQIAKTYSKEDATCLETLQKCEYKALNGKKNSAATYSSISYFDSIEEQIEHIRNVKLGPFNHFIAQFEGMRISEIYKLSGGTVFNLLKPKVIAQHEKVRNNTLKQSIIKVYLGKKDIIQHGQRIF